jgi:hypothetical protein
VALPFTLKKYLKKAKRKIIETQIFHHAKVYSSSKNPQKETKIFQDIITLL